MLGVGSCLDCWGAAA
uniref:Uncharacterized protein n=1 Tax=Arundo donax TaxID=35708 RepID=A0A0A8Y0G0_ARUDO